MKTRAVTNKSSRLPALPPVYLRIGGHILQSGRELRHAVVVPSQAHVRHAGHCHDVLDVPHLALVLVVGQVVVVEFVVVVVVG